MRAVLITGSLVLLWTASTAVTARAEQAGPKPPASPPLVIEHVAVVDVERGRVVADRRVVVEGTRITHVDAGGTRPAGARIIDGRGKYLVPGLWDMHIHSLTDRRFEYAFPLLLANGITGIRDMGSNLPPDTVNRIRRDAAEGRLLAPRFGALTYHILDGPTTQQYIAVAVATADQGRELVREYKRLGADFVKPYNLLPRDVYLAIVDEAKREHIAVEGHVPFSMTAAEVSDLGQRTIEHDFDILVSSSRDEAELRDSTRSTPTRWGQFEAKAAATFDETKAKALYSRLARNGTWMCPTIAFYRPIIQMADESGLNVDSLAKYVSQSLRERYQTLFPRQRLNFTLPEYRQTHWKMRSRIVGEMHRAGVGILAGTDAPAPFMVPGFGLHDELSALVDAGLTPLDALRAATLDPARFLGASDSLGTVAQGKLADLVLLDANPLADVHNTRKIRSVVANGRFFDRTELDALLAEAQRVAPTAERPRSR